MRCIHNHVYACIYDSDIVHRYMYCFSDVKGMTTYDYILLQRRREAEKNERKKKEAEEQEGREEGTVAAVDRDHHGRCWWLRRKVSSCVYKTN